MVSHWSLSDSKSPQLSGTLLSILSDLNKDAAWMVSILPLVGGGSYPFAEVQLVYSKAPT